MDALEFLTPMRLSSEATRNKKKERVMEKRVFDASQESILVSVKTEKFGDARRGTAAMRIGAVAYTEDGKAALGEFFVVMKDQDDGSIAWWIGDEPAAATATEENGGGGGGGRRNLPLVSPVTAMSDFRDWIASFSRSLKFTLVCYPAVLDNDRFHVHWSKFIGHALMRKGPIPSFRAIDVRSYASGRLRIPYDEATIERALLEYMPRCRSTRYLDRAVNSADDYMRLYLNIAAGKRRPPRVVPKGLFNGAYLKQ